MSNVSSSSNLEETILKYLEHCEIAKNLSQNTVKMYHFYLMDFLHWASDYLKIEKIKLSDLNNELIKKYRLNLNRRI
nr:site-specific integrase [Patescibacteria group bacterium]